MFYTRRATASSATSASSQQQSSATNYGGFVKSYSPNNNKPDPIPQPNVNQTPTMKPLEPESGSSFPIISSSSVASCASEMHDLVPAAVALNSSLPPESIDAMLGNNLQEETNDVAIQRKTEQMQKWKEARKKQGTYKVDKKLKKKRLNAKLEKVLKPKNAFLIFNELDLKPEYRIQDNMHSTGCGPPIKTYTAYLELNGKTYVGESTNIAGAKMVAADVALKDWFLDSLRKKETGVKDESKSVGVNPAPWSSVGSYAVHLLFTRWQMDVSNGTTLVPKVENPISSTFTSNSVVSPENSILMGGTNIPSSMMCNSPVSSDELVDYSVSTIPKLPANCEQYQPLYLFNLVFPGLTPVLKVDESLTDERCTVSCKVNGVIYEGKARNKKEARKKLAMKTLTAMGIPFSAAPTPMQLP